MNTVSHRAGWLRPSIASGLLAWAVYTAVVNAVQFSSGVPYADWFKTAENAFRVGVLSLLAGSVLLGVWLRIARWDHVWHDPVRLQTPRVMRWAIAAWWVVVAVRLAGVRWGDVPLNLVLAVVGAGVLVGFAEEVLFRGLFLRALRQGGRNEAAAVLWTSLCFGLFHLPNVFMGTGWPGLIQIVLAGLTGGLLYAFRRRYGTLWPAMVAHGLWDIAAFLAGNFPVDGLSLVSLLLQGVMAGLSIAVLVSVFRHDRGTAVLPSTA